MIKRKCTICGKAFYIVPSKIKYGKGKYCSQNCYWKTLKEYTTGSKNPNWKGDSVGYWGLHTWIVRQLGTPKLCVYCGTIKAKTYHWANISGEYKRNIKDFKRLCAKCHKKFDYKTQARGERQGNSKLTEKEVLEIRKLYVPYKYHIGILSKKFNVGRKTIHHIVRRESWKHI